MMKICKKQKLNDFTAIEKVRMMNGVLTHRNYFRLVVLSVKNGKRKKNPSNLAHFSHNLSQWIFSNNKKLPSLIQYCINT